MESLFINPGCRPGGHIKSHYDPVDALMVCDWSFKSKNHETLIPAWFLIKFPLIPEKTPKFQPDQLII